MMINIVRLLQRPAKDERGFTLVELMAVFAILAIIAAIAVPSFTGTMNAAKANADQSSALIIARAAEQRWLDDNEKGVKIYKASDLATDGYLQKAPKPQNNSVTDFVATVNGSGVCTGVYYGATVPDPLTGNLLGD